jgi:hypothetical protein
MWPADALIPIKIKGIETRTIAAPIVLRDFQPLIDPPSPFIDPPSRHALADDYRLSTPAATIALTAPPHHCPMMLMRRRVTRS